MAALLQLQNIAKSYGAVKALEGISFDVEAGEVLALVGDNGAGKSTTAKIIAGAISPDQGSISFNGTVCHWRSPREAQVAGIEMLYQDMGLAPDLSVAANIYLGREVRQGGVWGRLGFYDRAAMAKGAEEALAQLHVTVPRGQYPAAQLSGGQRQAVALAKSVTWTRKLLLLDEPTNHLGVSGTKEVLDIIRHIRDRGVGVVLISHTIPQVLAVADRILVLWQGQIIAVMSRGEATVESVVSAITGVKLDKEDI
jgi:simple sugar transport system ATP-binding protein